jgi:hypothetical protein
MSKRRSSPRQPRLQVVPPPTPPGFVALVQQARLAAIGHDWEEVRTLLDAAEQAPDAALTQEADPTIPAAVADAHLQWWMLEAYFWRTKAFTLADESVYTIEAMHELVTARMRAQAEGLDALGAPNPTPHALCRELLTEIAAIDAMEVTDLAIELQAEAEAEKRAAAERSAGRGRP